MSDVPPDDENQAKIIHQKAGDDVPEKKCLSCEATKTPMWRNGPCGNKTLCNACGVRLYRQQSKVPKKGEAGEEVEDIPLEGHAKATYLEFMRKLRACTKEEDIKLLQLEMQARTDIFSPEILSEIDKKVEAELSRIRPISLRKQSRSKRPRETFGSKTSGSDLDGWRNGGTGPSSRGLRKQNSGLAVSEDGQSLQGALPWERDTSPGMSHDLFGLHGPGMPPDNMVGLSLPMGFGLGMYGQPGLGNAHFSQDGTFPNEGTAQSQDQYRMNSYFDRSYSQEGLPSLPTMASGNTLPLLDLDTADFFVDPLPDLNAENSPYTPGLQVISPHANVISPHANQSTQTVILAPDESLNYFESSARFLRIPNAGCGNESSPCEQTPSSRRSGMSSPEVGVGGGNGTPQNRIRTESPQMQQFMPVGMPSQNPPPVWESHGNPRANIPSSSGGGLRLYSAMANKSVQFVTIQPSSAVPKLPLGSRCGIHGTASMGMSPRGPAGGLSPGPFPGHASAPPLAPINVRQPKRPEMASASPRSCPPTNANGSGVKLLEAEVPLIPGAQKQAVSGAAEPYPVNEILSLLEPFNSPVGHHGSHSQDPRELDLSVVDTTIVNARTCCKEVKDMVDSVLSEEVSKDYAARTCNGQNIFQMMYLPQMQASAAAAGQLRLGPGPRSPALAEQYMFPPGHMETPGLETLGSPIGNKLGAPMGTAIGGVSYASPMPKLEDGRAGNRCGEAAPRSPLIGVSGAARGTDAQPRPLSASTPPPGAVSSPYNNMHVPSHDRH